MPWQSRRQTRGLIAAAVKTLRDETIAKLGEITSNLQEVNTQVDDLTTSLNTVQDSMETLRLYTEHETKKLATLVEGAVRSILASDHGRQYTLARKVSSLRDVLCYIKDMRGENNNWLARAQGDVVDFLLSEDTITRAGKLMQVVFLESTEEGWRELREVVSNNPLVNDDEELVCRSFARAISPAPRFYRALLVEMKTVSQILDRAYFAESSLSLLTSLLASDRVYEEAQNLPPFQLEWDCQGAIEEKNDGTIYLSGAEIKSSKRGFNDGVNQLCRRFTLLVFLIGIIYPAQEGRQIVARGRVLALWLKNNLPINDTIEVKISPSAIAYITCEEIESIE